MPTLTVTRLGANNIPQDWSHVLRIITDTETFVNTTKIDFANVQTNGLYPSNTRSHTGFISIGQKCRNATGSELTAPVIVSIGGSYAAGGGVVYPSVVKADAEAVASYLPAHGILAATVADGADGTLLQDYELTSVNTSGSTVGDRVWLSDTAGGYRLTPPATPKVCQLIGYVSVVHASTGVITFHFPGTVVGNDLGIGATFTGATTLLNTLQIGVNDTGYDVKFFGATDGSYLLWDESADSLLLTDSTPLKIGDSQDLTLYHDGSNSYITNAVGALKIATETSGIAVTIGHGTSEVTIADNLTVTGTLTLGSGAELIEAELEVLNGVTAGTVAASKALVVDSNKDIASLRNITLTGELDAGSLDVSGDADIDGTLEADAITIGSTAIGSIYGVVAGSSSIVTTGALNSGSITSGFGNINTGSSTITTTGTLASGAITSSGVVTGTGFTIGSAVIVEAELETIDGITAGTVLASKALVVDSNKDIASLRNITLTGELDAGSLDVSGDADIDGTTNLDAVDIDGAVQVDATITVGVDDAGYDVKFFGNTASAYMLWDTSTDDLILGGAAQLGIGTAPSYTFEVASSTDGNYAAKIANSDADNGNGLFITAGDDANTFALRVMDYSGSTECLAVRGSGNVGIGISSSLTAKLSVSGDIDMVTTGNRIDFNTANTTSMRAANTGTLDFEILGADEVQMSTVGLLVADGYGMVIGQTEQSNAGGITPEAQVLGTAGPDSQLMLAMFNSGGGGPQLTFLKSRGTTINATNETATRVADGNAVGQIAGYADDGTDYVSAVAHIGINIDGTPDENDTPGRITFSTTPAGTEAVVERMRIDSIGKVFIGDTANTNMTVGLTINQGATDNQILTLKSPDVVHGITLPGWGTNDFCIFSKHAAHGGGARITGISDDETGAKTGIALQAISGQAADTTKSTSGQGILHVKALIKNGTDAGAPAANSNLMTVANYTATQWLVDAEGDTWQNGGAAVSGDIDMITTGNRIDFDTDNDTSIRASADDVLTFEAAGSDRIKLTGAGTGHADTSAHHQRGKIGHIAGGLKVEAEATGGDDTFVVTVDQSASHWDTGNTNATSIVIKLAGRYTASGYQGFFKEWLGYIGYSQVVADDATIGEIHSIGDSLKSNVTAATPARSAAGEFTVTFTNANSAAFEGYISVELMGMASDVVITVANNE